MKLNALRPVLWTDKLRETLDFYTEILGFTIDNYVEDWGWASVSKDDVEIMLSKPNAHYDFTKPVFTGSFYFNTDNVDACWQQVKDKATICYELETFDYGMREFAIYDNNGYLLQFGQEEEGN